MLERPRAPWHPLPLAEILIVAGAITVAVSLTSGGPERAAPGLIAGVAATLIGTGEVTAREHLRGYRSHALLLALIPVIAFHTLVFLAVSAVGSMPREANIALLALDLGLLYALFRFLRTRFLEARRRALEAAGGRLRGERGKG
ncbi:MAG: hypothetical protein KGJ43_08320 [Acidobacteriota bacterium]|nr:hypothetical protein [Acidobacteriota bacterium]